MSEFIKLQRKQIGSHSSVFSRPDSSPTTPHVSPAPTIAHNFSQVSVLPKLEVSQPHDPAEQEADRVAEQIMRMPEPINTEQMVMRSLHDTIHRKCAACEDEEEVQAKLSVVQRKPTVMRSSGEGLQTDSTVENRLSSSKGGGSPLPDEVRSFMEPRFGADFSQVRVHTSGDAVQMNRELNAQAFTHKQDVYFGAGKAPGKDALTAHELTHVVQQGAGSILRTSSPEKKSSARETIEQSENLQQQSLLDQTCSNPGMFLQRSGDSSDKQAATELHTRATAVSNKFRSGQISISSAVKDSLTTIDNARTTYLTYATKYDSAYGKVQGVLGPAKEKLELQDKVTDTIIGIAIGVAIGLGVGAFVEAIEVTSFAAKVAWEAIGEGLEAAGGWGVGKTQSDKRDAGNKALTDPPGTTPTAVKLDIWQKLAEAYRSAAEMSTKTEILADATHWADLVTGEALVHKSEGKGERSLHDIEQAVLGLERIAAQQALLQAKIGELGASRGKLQAAAEATGVPDERKLEQQIWIEWMANLPEDASNRLLDNDAIEDHLREVGVLTGDGKAGALKTDFESWTSKDDTDEAVEEAKSVRYDNYFDTFAPQQTGKIVQVTVLSGDIPTSVNILGTRWDWRVKVSPVPDENMSRPLPKLGENVKVTGYDTASKQLTGIGPI